MQILKLDPRALTENPDDARRSQSSVQADALLLATVKAVGIIQPPVVAPQRDGGNGYVIQAGHRRVRQAIAAGLEEIEVLVSEPVDDNGAMRSMIENIAREPLNPVDQWRGVERLVALGWTEEAIAVALALPVRQIRKLRLLANVLPAMLDQMAKGDMPSEQQLRTIAAASHDEQKEVWKAQKPKKGETASWWSIANGLTKTRMFARDARFGDDLRQAYAIEWSDDLFGPADQDNRFTTNVEAFLGAQQEWMTSNLPKNGAVVDVNNWGQPELPKKAERVYGKPGKGDHKGLYLDRDGKVQEVHYRLPTTKAASVSSGDDGAGLGEAEADAPKVRPDVTQRGLDMIGDLRTDALHEALARAPIEDDTLMALLILAFAGVNVSIASGSSDNPYGHADCRKHAARLMDEDGRLNADRETLQQVARAVLIGTMSLRRNRSDSGIAARIAGEAIGADAYLVNMGTDDFLSCLSRQALEQVADGAGVPGRIKVKDTRLALVEHFADGRLIHPAAGVAPSVEDVQAWMSRYASNPDKEGGEDGGAGLSPETAGVEEDHDELGEDAVPTDEEEDDQPFREAAE
jgi:ParB family transcriptional regulator, chromosome partitioning protein